MYKNIFRTKILVFVILISILFEITNLKCIALSFPANNSVLLASTNNKKVTVVSTTPKNKESNVSPKVIIAVKFSEYIKQGENFNKITLKDKVGNTVSISKAINNDTLFIYHNSTLNYDVSYTITIPEGAVKGLYNNYINEAYSFWFTTDVDRIAPFINEVYPENSSDDVDVDTLITIKYDEMIKESLYFKDINLVNNSSEEIPIDTFIKDDTITIKPRKRLNFDTYYHFTIPSEAVADIAGNKAAYYVTYKFKTESEKEPPVVKYTIPSNDMMYVPVDSNITIGFNKNILPVDLTNKKTIIRLKSGNKETYVDAYISGSMIYAKPSKDLHLAYNTKYTVEVVSGSIKDIRGNVFNKTYTFSFTTEPEVGMPKIIETNPKYASNDFMPDDKISVYFNEAIQIGDTFKNITLKDEKGNNIPFIPLIGWDAIGLKPKNNLEYNTEYYFQIPKGAVKNLSGDPLKYDYIFKFKTSLEKFPPDVKATNPSNGQSNVSTNSIIGILFKENIQKGENFNYITLKDEKGNDIPISIDIKDDLLNIKPINNVSMTYYMTYTVKIPRGAVNDLAGNSCNEYTFSFTTGFDKILLNLLSCNVKENDKNVPIDSTFTFEFNDSVLKGEFFDNIAIKDSKGNIVKSIVTIDNNRVNIKPELELKYNSSYSIEVPYWSLVDSRRNAFLGIPPIKFTTEPKNNAVTVKSTYPKNKEKEYDPSKPITITFNRDIAAGSDFNNINLIDKEGKIVISVVNIEKDTITINPMQKLTPEGEYTVSIPYTSVKDQNGKVMADDYKLSFKVKSDKDKVVQKAINITSDFKYIVVTFSDNIKSGKNFDSITLKDSKGKAVKYVKGIVNNMLVIVPNIQIKKNEKFYVYIPSQALSDTKGNLLNKTYNLEIQANEKYLWKK
ncbi:hypothetical protein FDN13_04595 [Caloramator sp. E03]|uniref:Ig-like domain-containing protein n=1 Tax=Caloramator sp. E03 TaxID=2576307 RepID=UPI00111064FB|nr:Ig-like domain-containing protein [Caloramator sp. E03]QCX33046.1 hypothetical protein FDN13_04595 [Caloramator sp. E03]